MNAKVRTYPVFVAMLFLASCAQSMPPAFGACTFRFDENIRDKLVVPAILAKEGQLIKLYDLERPGIINKKGIVTLIFRQKDQAVIDTPNFFVVIDSCKWRVVSSGETTPGLITDAPSN